MIKNKYFIYLFILFILSISLNINHLFKRPVINYIDKERVVKEIIIKPKVVEKIKYVYRDNPNPSTNEKKTGSPSVDIKIMDNAIPLIKIDPIEIKQTKNNIYVPSKVDAILDYGYNRHYMEINLETVIKKNFELNIKANTMWSMDRGKFIHDYELSWEIFKYNNIGINVGAGIKQMSITSSFDIIGNLDFHAGASYFYGGGLSPTIGFSLDLF